MPESNEVSYDPLDLGGPRYAPGEWPLPEPSFEPLREQRLANPQALDRDGLLAYFASMGWLADLSDDERLPLLDEVRSRLASDEYRRHWETRVHWTRRGLPARPREARR